jgi:predicted histidine transporter YuiF (NhaC family)
MEVNYTLAGAVLIAVIGLIVFLIVRNRKDKKAYEQEIIESERKPEQHDAEQI